MKGFVNLITVIFICVILVSCGSKDDKMSQNDNSTALAKKVVNTLKTQVGRSYKLGGSSPKSGFDCSGLIYWAYNEHGISVPRTTKKQAKAGKKVSRKSLRAGDIIVFKSKPSPNGLHTAVYLGNNKIIHAPNAKKDVEIVILNGGYWGEQFKEARRIIGKV